MSATAAAPAPRPRPSRRQIRKGKVRDWLLINGPASIRAIASGTRLTLTAVSRAIVDIRNDPGLEIVTVPTKSDGYTYRIAYTLAEALAGALNQAYHMRTRAKSQVALGDKLLKIATTPDEIAKATALKMNGQFALTQADLLIGALS